MGGWGVGCLRGLSDDTGSFICCNCDQVIPTSGGISRHMDLCAAIAEIESGENVENSLFDAPDGQSHVQPTVVVFKRDPWAGLLRKQGGGEGDKGTKEREG
jgi:hypothetical protein